MCICTANTSLLGAFLILSDKSNELNWSALLLAEKQSKQHSTRHITTQLHKQPVHWQSITQHKQHHYNILHSTTINHQHEQSHLTSAQAYGTVNIHINNVMHTIIPNAIFKFIENYIKGRNAYTNPNKVNSILIRHNI